MVPIAYLNNLFWNLNYFDTASSFAADVKNPGKAFPRAMLIAIVFIVVAYFVPLMVAIGVWSPNNEHTGQQQYQQEAWVDGYMAEIVSDTMGSWCGISVVVGISLSTVGLYEADLSYLSLKLLGMAERGFLPAVLAKRSTVYGTPVNAILVTTVVTLILTQFGTLTTLVEILNFNYAV
eukprot:CAMPEP_0116544668 /NCGR_PEP_ID=MMETSP0397-20121206/2243_1 /TAXON_ID=216820 /ORGANISM="Cyclophora tenuis, Strain ECT3854" /LENGTH=177 /DNA_ID=CAMNT_0004068901 /DNA_START=79 /DNA_END=612 /DNA_ORIENTATION=-